MPTMEIKSGRRASLVSENGNGNGAAHERRMEVIDDLLRGEPYTWTTDDVTRVAAAEREFERLRERGYTAFTPGAPGEPTRVVERFDPEADVSFVAKIAGG